MTNSRPLTAANVPDEIAGQTGRNDGAQPRSISGRLVVVDAEFFKDDRFSNAVLRSSMVIYPLNTPCLGVAALTPMILVG